MDIAAFTELLMGVDLKRGYKPINAQHPKIRTKANSVGPEQMPRLTASDSGLHYLRMTYGYFSSKLNKRAIVALNRSPE